MALSSLKTEPVYELPLLAHALDHSWTEALLQTCPDCVYVYDIQDGRLVYCNRSLYQVLGYQPWQVENPEAVIPQQFMHEDDYVDPRGLMRRWQLMQEGSIDVVEFRLRDAGGNWRYFRARIKVLARSARHVKTVLGVITDISEQKWAEKRMRAARDAAEKASAAKGQFLAEMSHEIRTPLNGIVGMVSLLSETSLSEEQNEYVQVITRTSHGLLGIVNQVLDYAKIEAGKLELRREPFSLAEMVEDCVAVFAEKTAAKGVVLCTYLSPRLPARCLGDAERLRQVLVNLLSNAVKFTDHGSITVSAEALTDKRNGKQGMRVTVTDTGVGIPVVAQAKIFQKYVQAEGRHAMATGRGGTGLGLAIAKQLVELMQGSIACESVEGEGSRFWFDVELEGEPMVAMPADLTGMCQRIRLVSDSLPSAEALQRQLTAWGMQVGVTLVDNIAEALPTKLALVQDFDAIILDRRQRGGIPPAVIAAWREAAHGHRLILLVPLVGSFSHCIADQQLSILDLCLAQPPHWQRLAAFLQGQTKEDAEVAESFSPERQEKAETKALQPVVAEGASILVVDDNPDNVNVVTRMLKKCGYHSQAVDNGYDAVAAMERQPFQLVLLDCQMPGMDGFATARAMRRLPNGQHCHIVALTANAFEENRQACLAAGMDDMMTKPLLLTDLRASLLRWCVAPSSSKEEESHESHL